MSLSDLSTISILTISKQEHIIFSTFRQKINDNIKDIEFKLQDITCAPEIISHLEFLLKSLKLLKEYIQVLENTTINENISQYLMENHFDSLVAICSEEILELLFPSKIKKKIVRLRWWGALAEQMMEFFYLVLNFVGFIIALAATCCIGSNHWLCSSSLSYFSDSIWNHQDSVNGFIMAFHQWKKGEKTVGVANLLNSLGLAVCTIIANLSVNYLAPPVIHLSNTAICGLMSYGLALSTVIPAVIEDYMAFKHEKLITLLEQKIIELKNSPNTENKNRKLFDLYKTKTIETAEYNQHLRSRDTLFACSIGMIAVAVISFIILSGATYGGLPAMLVVGYATAFAAGFARQCVLSFSKKNDLKKIRRWTEEINNDLSLMSGNDHHEPIKKYNEKSCFAFFKSLKKKTDKIRYGFVHQYQLLSPSF